MDLDDLVHRHQTSLLCAATASCAEARIVHEGLAELYASRIRNLRRKSPDNAPLALSAFAGAIEA